LSGGEMQNSSDYEDEEGSSEEGHMHSEEETCNECGGMMEAGHSCGSKEMVDEVESEDQMAYAVAETNAPDSGADNTNADVAGNAAANSALATADAGADEEEGQVYSSPTNEAEDETGEEAGEEDDKKDFFHNPNVPADKQLKAPPKEVNIAESFANLYKKLAFLSEESTSEKDDKAEKAGEKEVDETYSPNSVDAENRRDLDASHAANLKKKAAAGDAKAQAELQRLKDKKERQSNDFNARMERESAGMDESALQAAFGMKKYTKTGMEKLQQLGREGASEKTKAAARKKFDQYDDKKDKVDESYANSADDTFEADIDFMTKVISGGLNKQKSTGQTTIPVIAGQGMRTGIDGKKDIKESMLNESVNDWKKLAGIIVK
jgi:hypothetical protein